MAKALLAWFRHELGRQTLLTGLKSIRASPFQCTASVLEQTAFFSFNLNFVLNHEFQLKLAKF